MARILQLMSCISKEDLEQGSMKAKGDLIYLGVNKDLS
jgi:hypothetical protein